MKGIQRTSIVCTFAHTSYNDIYINNTNMCKGNIKSHDNVPDVSWSKVLCYMTTAFYAKDVQGVVVTNVYNVSESPLIGFRMSSTMIWMVLPVHTWLWGLFIDSGHVFLKCIQLLCFKRRYKPSFNTSHRSLIILWEMHRTSVRISKGYQAVTETPSCKESSQDWILNSMSMLKRHEQGRPYLVHCFLRRRS